MKTKSPEVRFQRPEARRVGLLMSDAEVERRLKEWVDDDHVKLLTLCKHFGIKTGQGMFYELSLALARELYPEPKKSGARQKWTSLNRGALVVEIERLVKPGDPALGVTWAAKQLAKREPWGSLVGKKSNPGEALRKAYQDFKDDRFARMSRDAFCWHVREGTLAEWDAFVTDVVKNPDPE